MDQPKPSSANSSPLTPLNFLERAAVVYGDSPSVVYNNTTYTWNETYHRCLSMASSISSMGIKHGHVVSVLAPNTPAMYELQFAIPMSGAILNNINTRLDAHTISILLCHSESKLIFVDAQFATLVQEAISLFQKSASPPLLVLIEDNEFPSHTVAEFKSTYEKMVDGGDPEFTWIRPLNEWDPMVLNYTSGTTSSPKGVVHCHRGIFIMVLDAIIDWPLPKEPILLWTLPMFHTNGWSFPWGMAVVGGTNVCLRKFDGAFIYNAIRRYGVTHMCGAPVVLNMLCNSPERTRLDRMVEILTAGAPPPAAVLARTESLGFSISHGYGLTETAGIVVSCAWKKEWNRLPATERARLKSRQGVRTIGMTEIDVVDPNTGLSVKRDGCTLGEVVLRGGNVMVGYWKDPEGTANALRDNGWFYSGDVGVMHADGYMEIKDRSKDVIISGGENVSSVEIESVLYSHSDVNEAAVVARPDDYWGETPCAFVSLKIGEIEGKLKPSEREIVEFCRTKLPHYMVPKTVVFKDELPKTSTGKIQKFALREIARAMGSHSRSSRL